MQDKNAELTETLKKRNTVTKRAGAALSLLFALGVTAEYVAVKEDTTTEQVD